MRIVLEGTPDEIAQWARQVAGAQPCLLPHYPALTGPVVPLTWPGPTVPCAPPPVFPWPGTGITWTVLS